MKNTVSLQIQIIENHFDVSFSSENAKNNESDFSPKVLDAKSQKLMIFG